MLVDFSRPPLVVGRKPCEWPKHRALARLVFLFLVALSVAAQLRSLTPTSPAPVPATQEQLSDPLGRTTPRGTFKASSKRQIAMIS